LLSTADKLLKHEADLGQREFATLEKVHHQASSYIEARSGAQICTGERDQEAVGIV
jgi:hypothetical protein